MGLKTTYKSLFFLNTLTCSFSLYDKDEAPDTGDDSDDDLITNYLGGGHPGGIGQVAKGANGAAGGGAIPSIHLTSSQASNNTNHILGKAFEVLIPPLAYKYNIYICT